MSALFDDSPGTIFASAAGLIVYFGLVSILQAWQGKFLPYCEFNFHKGGGYISELKQLNDMVPLH